MTGADHRPRTAGTLLGNPVSVARNGHFGDAKPKLLLLSHCVPVAGQDPQRSRAWQLVRQASRTHQIYLACLQDGPVNFQHWRALHACCAQVLIEPANPLLRLWQSLTLRIPAALYASRSLQNTLLAARIERHFDAVITTHPALWSLAISYHSRLKICDLRHHTAPPEFPAHAQQGWRHLAQRWLQSWRKPLDCRIAQYADAVLVSPLAPGQSLPLAAHQLLEMPSPMAPARALENFLRPTPFILKLPARVHATPSAHTTTSPITKAA